MFALNVVRRGEQGCLGIGGLEGPDLSVGDLVPFRETRIERIIDPVDPRREPRSQLCVVAW